MSNKEHAAQPGGNPRQARIDEELANLERRKAELMEKKRGLEKKAADERRRALAKERKNWEADLIRVMRKYYPMPPSEIVERLDRSLEQQPGD